ncbi:Tyrosine recombinase XerC [Herbaspirillum sp. BH-1]|uniref:phage integrase n=1 Tax=Herbaspirillum sp. (strain BH-1) TaxID=2058884 RepID=UPI000C881B81|nr:DUF6538 domain-containing protein [Herbaspirillum sp. BH-1]PLY61380.1 Tyrosine recombinase XerC [Herbaspirillum sp. BH-1]
MKITLGVLKVTLKHSFARGGVIYYQRAVPADLHERYGAKRLKISLETADVRIAARKIEALDKQFEAEWALLREAPQAAPKGVREQAEQLLRTWGLDAAPAQNDPIAQSLFHDHLDDKRGRYANGDETVYWNADGRKYLTPVEIKAAQMLAGSAQATLSDALELYLKVHPKRDQAKFAADARRSFQGLIDAVGDKPLSELTREDAHGYVSKQQEKGHKTATIRRNLNSIKAIVELYFREKEIHRQNPFSALPIPGEGSDSKKRRPFSNIELRELVARCRQIDDDIRWLIAMLADTGARLAEITGLVLEDIVLDGDIPHVVIQPHPWRSLKNKDSERKVPLVGAALWAARRVVETASEGQKFAFPRYASLEGTKATHASNTIADWIRSISVEGRKMDHTAHELRHTVADRLRDVQCPEDIRYAIGGWALQEVGAKYGTGYGLSVKAEWLSKIIE